MNATNKYYFQVWHQNGAEVVSEIIPLSVINYVLKNLAKNLRSVVNGPGHGKFESKVSGKVLEYSVKNVLI